MVLRGLKNLSGHEIAGLIRCCEGGVGDLSLPFV